MKLAINQTHNMDCLEGLRLMDEKTVDCCVTSPPYWGLRDYGNEKQLGLESTPEEYVENMVKVFREVRRVLKDNGTLWLNLGDSYCGTGSKGDWTDPKYKDGRNGQTVALNNKIQGLKSKDLVGIPWRVAFALQQDGWYLRQDIIWAKPNPMPESVTDRCTKSHEHIFLLSKSAKYYFDAEAIAEPVAQSTVERLAQDIENQQGSERVPNKTNGTMKAAAPRYGGKKYTETPDKFNRTKSGNIYEFRPMRNKRDVWTVTTQPCKEAHFATFPPKLIEPCILAGCPKDGIVLDPFMGSGTTAMVALQHGRNYIGFELNEEYIQIQNKARTGAVQIRLEANL